MNTNRLYHSYFDGKGTFIVHMDNEEPDVPCCVVCKCKDHVFLTVLEEYGSIYECQCPEFNKWTPGKIFEISIRALINEVISKYNLSTAPFSDKMYEGNVDLFASIFRSIDGIRAFFDKSAILESVDKTQEIIFNNTDRLTEQYYINCCDFLKKIYNLTKELP